MIKIVGRATFHSLERVFAHLISERSNDKRERKVLSNLKRAVCMLINFKKLTSEVAH
jgi:hypothetical protein